MAELSTIARPYAKAAFEFAQAASTLTEWSSMLATASAVSQHETVQKLLTSPAASTESQAQTFIEVCGDTVDVAGENFIKILAENKRLGVLPMIHDLFEAQKANLEQTVNVDITTAFALDSASEKLLAEVLSKKLACQVDVQSHIDSQLIGGVVIRTGDLVIDGSVRGRLAKLAEAMNS
ncbi:MAG: F0F1 ATP synthase subunit delta [Spongiibacteraceae bacterium]